MWQTIEWKANAIEQFRKGDLLQRVIDDVQSEAANAAEMKAAASGNPLILLQVQLASDLRKLEALNSQHQRSQHRLKDRLKWLSSAQERLAKAENTYIENCKRRDTRTNTYMDKGNKRILLEFVVNGKPLREKDKEQIMEALRGGVKSVTREKGTNFLIGSYRGFDVSMRHWFNASGPEGFRFVLGGSGNQDFQPDNLVYAFDDKFSLSGFFQRLDNFLDKGLAQGFETYKNNVAHELTELATVKAALGQEFPQKAELDVTRENHAAVMRELQRMQNEPGYVSTWEPKAAGAPQAVLASTTELAVPVAEAGETPASPSLAPTQQPQAKGVSVHKLRFGEGDGRTEYTVSNQHVSDGYTASRTYFSKQVGSLGQVFYDDGQWHATAIAPSSARPKRFETLDAAMRVARQDAIQRAFEGAETQAFEAVPLKSPPPPKVTYHSKLADAGFWPTGGHFHGKDEHKTTIYTKDGGEFDLWVFKSPDGKIGLRVQYEKDYIIDGKRTINGKFDTLDEALDFAQGYRRFAEQPSESEKAAVVPPTQERENVASRMRLR